MAIAAGRVVDVSIAALSWGSLVVIEHVDARGKKFCSLYAHLGPLVCVRQGQGVVAGQKIGAIGRSCTQENGGYVAHLHFGIHAGPAGGWVSGYISPEAFKSGRHGWVDPQAFLRKRMGEAAGP